MATVEFELKLHQSTGFQLIAGLDEAGRGALAGPVAAAAVILPLGDPERLEQLRDVNDSKQLTARRREQLYDVIIANALAYGIGAASPERIDQEGIVSATKHAMVEAIKHLRIAPDYLLIDGPLRLRGVATPQKALVRGDSKSLSIASASILAKVTRDRYMEALADLYPQYGFDSHKGYATPQHLAAIREFGPVNVHRHTFAPVRQRLLE